MIDALVVFGLIELTVLLVLVALHVFRTESALKEQTKVLYSILTCLEKPMAMEFPLSALSKLPMRAESHNHAHAAEGHYR